MDEREQHVEQADSSGGVRPPKGSGLPAPAPARGDYRTCPQCARDLEPDVSLTSDEHGARIVWSCRTHGAQWIVDPFSQMR